jgi:hypothetical protein
MRDKNVYAQVKDDIVLPGFLENFASREYVEVLQGRQFTMGS